MATLTSKNSGNMKVNGINTVYVCIVCCVQNYSLKWINNGISCRKFERNIWFHVCVQTLPNQQIEVFPFNTALLHTFQTQQYQAFDDLCHDRVTVKIPILVLLFLKRCEFSKCKTVKTFRNMQTVRLVWICNFDSFCSNASLVQSLVFLQTVKKCSIVPICKYCWNA